MKRATAGRRLLVPIATTVVIVAVLLSLGVWQLERRVDKLALIAALDDRLAAAPVALPPAARWGAVRKARDEFRRVTLTGVIDADEQAQVFASGSPLRKDVSGTGVWVFAPVRLASGETVVVNRGFLADGQEMPPLPANEPVTLTGYIRFPEPPGWLTPHADRTKHLWFVRDHLAMAQALGWADPQHVAPFYIDLEAPVPTGGGPKPGPLQVSLKNDHLQYAVTWFLLAAAVTIAFGFWLRGQKLPPSSSL
ncbi:SURF1 family cytochrome oxidase biogenesis protein [Bradyrhizobium sp. LHD-71]|uniref:SURF1 family protein n=1 Tax=Bradyrhizobium sp. LHD-71 TaxID=3072141 RepID=UPI00280EF5B8|nr:SURF1 family cytochrome oxidase biogenesis protein [Bradyrhizobium sp. LHD-71]MDQ8730391.1 SURF1 family cytochrome oxidase biogenesis protein [Bradyrhizobium sp. LHD-71]